MVALGHPIKLEDWRQSGNWFQHRGHMIFYREEGDGVPLLCIHGFPTASWDWQRVWSALTQRNRVLAPDMIGFGFSAKPRDHLYSISGQATLHEELLALCGIDRVHLLVHDYGDTVAQELLARHLERGAARIAGPDLQSVCFLNGGLFPETHRPRFIQRLLASPIGPLLGRLTTERSFRGSFAAIFGPATQPSREELRDFWQLVSGNGGARIMHKLIGYMEERRRQRERWVGALQQTSVPLRLIDGALDPVSGRHMAERYRELVPDPDVVILAEIGHYPQVEAPEAVLEAYLEFRKRIELKRGPADSQ